LLFLGNLLGGVAPLDGFFFLLSFFVFFDRAFFSTPCSTFRENVGGPNSPGRVFFLVFCTCQAKADPVQLCVLCFFGVCLARSGFSFTQQKPARAFGFFAATTHPWGDFPPPVSPPHRQGVFWSPLSPHPTPPPVGGFLTLFLPWSFWW